MKKVIGLSFLLFSFILSAASIDNEIPDKLTIHAYNKDELIHQDIKTKTQKLATLLPHFSDSKLSYTLKGANEETIAVASVKFTIASRIMMNITNDQVIVDITDQTGNRLGTFDQKLPFYPPLTFEIIGPDNVTKLARASTNFWGNKLYIYDPVTDQEMARLYRPFFHPIADWAFKMTNRSLLNQKNIDKRLLLTALALQGELQNWKLGIVNGKYEITDNALKPTVVNTFKNPLKHYLRLEKELKLVEKPSREALEAEAATLDTDFHTRFPSLDALSNEERDQAFITYCMNLASSTDLPLEKRKAILTLLSMRMSDY